MYSAENSYSGVIPVETREARLMAKFHLCEVRSCFLFLSYCSLQRRAAREFSAREEIFSTPNLIKAELQIAVELAAIKLQRKRLPEGSPHLSNYSEQITSTTFDSSIRVAPKLRDAYT